MSLLITCLIVMGIATIVFWGLMTISEGFTFSNIFPSMYLSFIVTAIFFIASFFYSYTIDTELHKVKEYEISALKDNSVITGQSFLGSGYIDGSQYYFYVIDTKKGKKVEEVSTDDAYVNECNCKPRVEVYSEYYTGKINKLIFGDVKYKNTEYIFYIPEDSITTQFNIDLE